MSQKSSLPQAPQAAPLSFTTYFFTEISFPATTPPSPIAAMKGITQSFQLVEAGG
jgi:hypothetical protein